MRRLLLIGAALAFMTGPALAADPVSGKWAMPQNKWVIQITDCDHALCGVLVGGDKLAKNPDRRDARNENPGLRTRPLRGMPLLFGFTGGPASWTGGKVYNPSDGKTYKGEMKLASADTLTVKGCVVKPLCKTQVLTRVH